MTNAKPELFTVDDEPWKKVKILVEQLPNQHAYDAFLLQCSDPDRRRKMFDFTKGFCKFPDPQFPSTLKTGGLVGPDGRPL